MVEAPPLTQAKKQFEAEKSPNVKIPMRVNELDLLRFIAAFMVLIFHYGFRGYAADNFTMLSLPAYAPVSKYGYLGVQLFFMISGFVILMTASAGSLKKFMISRIVRLYPAFWACCTITFVAILIVGDARFKATFGQYLANLTMLNEFFDVQSIDGVYWTLAVEFRFYLLVALVLFIGQIRHALWFLVIWLLVSIVFDALPKDAPYTYRLRSFFIVDNAHYFIAGATGYLIRANGVSLLKMAIFFVAWLIAMWTSIQSTTALEVHYRTVLDPVIVGLIITLFFAVVALLSLNLSGSLAKQKWLALGALTYPLYLLHQNLGYMSFNYLYGSVNEHILLWGTIFSMLGLAYLVHTHVEARFSEPLKTFLNNLPRILAKNKPRADLQ